MRHHIHSAQRPDKDREHRARHCQHARQDVHRLQQMVASHAFHRARDQRPLCTNQHPQ